MRHTTKPSTRIAFALTALGALALAGLSMGWLDAGFISALGDLAAGIAETVFGADETTAKAVEIGTEALGRIAKLLFF